MITTQNFKKCFIFFLACALVCTGGISMAAYQVPDDDPEGGGGIAAIMATAPTLKWSRQMGTVNQSKAKASPATVNLDADATLEVIAATTNLNTSGNPINGAFYIWNSDGSNMAPAAANGLYSYMGVLQDSTSPAIADIENNGSVPEIIVADFAQRVRIWKTNSTVPYREKNFTTSPETGSVFLSSAVVADLDPTKTGLEVIAAAQNGDIFAFNHSGTGVINLNNGTVDVDSLFAKTGTAANQTTFYSSPAVGDLNHDGTLQVVAMNNKGKIFAWKRDGHSYLDNEGTYNGFLNKGLFARFNYDSDTRSSPVLADLDGDAKLEVIAGYGDKVFAWYSKDNDGDDLADPVDGWSTPKTLDGNINSSVVVADIDKEDGLEIVTADMSGKVYAWHMDGTVVGGFPVSVDGGASITSSVAVGDIDGDGMQEILVGDHNGKIYAWDNTGTREFTLSLEATPQTIEYSSIAVEDIDKDSLADIIIGCNNGKIYVYGFTYAYNASKIQWAKFRKDLSNSGNYLRKAIFEDKFDSGSGRGGLDADKWTIHDRAERSGGQVIYRGDGTPYRADGTGAKKKFKRDRNLIFLAEGFQFTELDPSYSVVFGGGRGNFIETANSPHRRIVLTIEDTDKVKDPVTGVITDGPEPPRFIVWKQVGIGTGTGTHVVRSNHYQGDGSVDPYYSTTATRNSLNFPSEVPQVNTRYSAVLRWLGDPNDGDSDRIELYVFETDKGIDSVGGPVYVSTDTDVINGLSMYTPMDWDPGVGGGMWVGFGMTKLDYVAVYGEDDAVKLQNAPTISPVIQEVVPNAAGGVNLVTPSAHTPGTRIVLKITGSLTLGAEDVAQYPQGSCSIWGCTTNVCAHSNRVDYYCYAGETPDLVLQSPAGAMFMSGTNTPGVGYYISYGSGYFQWDIPYDQPSGVYNFNYRLVSESGLQEEIPFSVTVYRGGGGGCFLAGTPITMADGSTKPIEKVKKGDAVLSFDQDTGTFKPDKVTKLLRHKQSEYLLVNGHLKVTRNHPVITDSAEKYRISAPYKDGMQWVQIGMLKEGDRIMNAKGAMEPIRSMERVEGKFKTYNFEVNPYHTYIAGGMVVHNKMFKAME